MYILMLVVLSVVVVVRLVRFVFMMMMLICDGNGWDIRGFVGGGGRE